MPHHFGHIVAHTVVFFVLFLVLLLSFLAYLLPSVVAFYRGHTNRLWIASLNILLGWSLVGWLVCMIWACTRNTQHTVCRCGSGEPCDYDEHSETKAKERK